MTSLVNSRPQHFIELHLDFKIQDNIPAQQPTSKAAALNKKPSDTGSSLIIHITKYNLY